MISTVRDALRRFGARWSRHPVRFGVPAGIAFAALWIRFGPRGDFWLDALWIGLCVAVVLVAAHRSRGEDDAW